MSSVLLGQAPRGISTDLVLTDDGSLLPAGDLQKLLVRKLDQVLADTDRDGEGAKRATVALQLKILALQLVRKQGHGAFGRNFWDAIPKVAKATTSVAAAGAGAALLAHLTGPTGVALGAAALVLAVLGAIGTAISPDDMHDVEKTRTILYEKLAGDIWDYALVLLPGDSVKAAEERLSSFRARYARIRALGSSYAARAAGEVNSRTI
jgi:hypothetical protein